jgi:hypothetical protein
MRYCAALLAVTTLAGCTGHWSSVGPVTHERATHRGVRSCLRAWNGTANAAARRATVPPFGSYPLIGQGPALTPKGGYQAFVGLSGVFGALGTNPPPVCYVYFRFPHGAHGGPALVSYPEIHRAAGVYGSPSISTGKNTDVGGRIYRQDAAGRLRPTDRFRPT